MPEKSNRRTVMEHFNPILGHETTGPKFITCGEIMLRLTPPNYEKLRMATNFEASYGGSEANIALALANLGVDSTFFSVVPNNSLGKSAVRWLRSNDVHCTPMILIEPDETPSNRLGTYYLETGYGIRPSKVIYDRKHSAITEYDFSQVDLDELLEGCGLTRTNIIYSGGGHCYLLLPSTAAVQQTLADWNRAFNGWLNEQFGVQLFLANGWTPCSANVLCNVPAEASPYKALFRRVNAIAEQHKQHPRKLRRMLLLRQLGNRPSTDGKPWL